MPSALSDRGRIAALSRSRRPDDPELVAARQRLKFARLALAINSEPRLTFEQVAELVSMLVEQPAGGDVR